MRPCLKSVSLFTTTLLLSLTPSLLSRATTRVAPTLDFLLPASAQIPTTQNRQAEADRLFQEGVQQYRQGYYSKAVATYQRVLEIRQQLNDKAGIGQTLNNLGEVYSWLRQHDKALEVLQQALVIRRELKNRAGEGETLDNLGFAYYFKQQNDKSLETLQQALTIRRELNDKAGEGKTLSNLGLIYWSLEQYPKALETLEQALAIQQQLGDKFLTGITLRRIGRVYENMKDYPRALEWAEKSLAVNREVKNRAGEGESLIAVGDAYYYLEKYDRFLELYQQALPLIREAKIRSLEVSILYWMGDTYFKQKQYQQVIDLYQQALPIAQEIPNNKFQEGTILSLLGDVYYQQVKYDRAIEFYQQALPIAREAKDKFREAQVLTAIGNVYYQQIQYDRALAHYQQALSIAREVKNRGQKANIIAAIGDVYYQRIQYERALEFYQQALTIAREAKDKFREAKIISAIGFVYFYKGQSKQAIEFYQQALSIMQEIQDKSSQAELLIILGDTYRIQGDSSKSKELLEQGLKIAQEEKNPLLQSAGLNAIAYLYNSQDQYQKALELAQQSLKIAQELNLPLYNSKYTLATIYFSLGDYNKSREIYQQLLAIVKQQKNLWYEGSFLLDMAYTYFVQGEPQKTVEFAQQALAIAQELQDPFLATWANINLSIGYGNLGNDQKAMETAQTFLAFTRKVQNPIWEKIALRVIGGLHYRFGRKEESIQAFQQALAIQVPYKDAEILAGLARTYRDLNQPNVAITYYKESVNKIEEIRQNIQSLSPELKKSFLDTTIDFDKGKVSDIYRQLAALLLSQGREKEALQVQQFLREQEIREAVSPRDAAKDKPNIPLTPAERKIPAQSESIIALAKQINECETTNCSQLTELNTRRTALINEFDQKLQKIDQEIRANRAKDDAFFDPNKLAIIQEIVEAQSGKVMIYPLVLEQELWIQFYAPEDVVKSIKVNVGRDELGKAVKEFRDLMEECEKRAYCGSADTTKLQTVSQKLYNWLIKPLEEELQNNQVKHLVFALDRVTRYIPMSALHDGKQYLIEKYTIYNVLTEDTSNVNKSDRLSGDTQNTPILAMGVSDAIAGYNPLPNVPSELNAIVRQETKGNQGIYPGEKFLNDVFDFPTLQDNLRNFKILHLATHAVFVPDSADQSYILLGTGEKLTIPQIKTLTGLNNIHLVVLSACQTALAGPRQDGIEIASTAYHFLNRGAKSVIASLWLVNDASTSLLMQQFYNNLASGTSPQPMTKAEALRQSQLSMLQGKVTAKDVPQRSLGAEPRLDLVATGGNSNSPDFSHPYYWAPFILIGNGL